MAGSSLLLTDVEPTAGIGVGAGIVGALTADPFDNLLISAEMFVVIGVAVVVGGNTGVVVDPIIGGVDDLCMANVCWIPATTVGLSCNVGTMARSYFSLVYFQK
jgi:hypothetical protein